ncbi:interleukin-17D-like isoform X2 [Centroberyx affinis]|uniref:interleukin-17D-like isoform X2 n=1 Tax=Centroberyx affinis TaxID=166261 RepID=UPI003A5B9456
MTWVSLQMICTGWLLILSDRTAAAAARNCSRKRCCSQTELEHFTAKFEKKYHREKFGIPRLGELRELEPHWDRQSCSSFTLQTASQQLGSRSLSPWRIDDEDGRIPRHIAMAECLCEGCIVNQREDLGYNSVPVRAQLTVLRKTTCPGDAQRFLITAQVVEIPVACTCVVPKTAKRK